MIKDSINLFVEEDFLTAISITPTSPTLFKIKFYMKQADRDKIKYIRCIFQNKETFNESFKNNFFNETKSNKSYSNSSTSENTLLRFYKRNVSENFITSRNENTLSLNEKTSNIFHEIQDAEILYSKGFLYAFIPQDVTNNVKNKIKKGFVRIEFISEVEDILFKTDFIGIDFEEVYNNKTTQSKMNIKTIDASSIFNSESYIKKIPTNINSLLISQAKNIVNNISPDFDKVNNSINFSDLRYSNIRQNSNNVSDVNIKIDNRYNSFSKISNGIDKKIEFRTEDIKEKLSINKNNSSSKTELLSSILSKRSRLISIDLDKKDSNKTENLNKYNTNSIGENIELEVSVKVGNKFNTENKRKSITLKKKISLPINKQLVNNIVKQKKADYMKRNILEKLGLELSFDFLDKNIGVITLESLPLEDYFDFIYVDMFEGIIINKKKNSFKLYSSPSFSSDDLIEFKTRKKLLSVFRRKDVDKNEKGRYKYQVYFDASKVFSLKEVELQIDLIENETKVTKYLKSTELKTKEIKAYRNIFVDIVKKINSIIDVRLNKTVIDFNTGKSKNLLHVKKITNKESISELFDFAQSLGYDNQNYLKKTDLIKSLIEECIAYVEIETTIENKKFEIQDSFIIGNKVSFIGDNLEIDLSYINEKYNEYDIIQNLKETTRENYDFLFLNNEKILDVYKPNNFNLLLEKKVKVLLLPIPFLLRKYRKAGLDKKGNIVNKYSDENELNEIEKTFYDFIYSFNHGLNYFKFLSIKKDFFDVLSDEKSFHQKIRSLILNSTERINFKEVKESISNESVFLEITSAYNISENHIQKNKVNIINEKRILEKISSISKITHENKNAFSTKLLEGKFINNFKDYSIYELKELSFFYNRFNGIKLDILSDINGLGLSFNKENINIFSCFVPVVTSDSILLSNDITYNKYFQVLSTDDSIKILPNDEYFLSLDQERHTEYFYGLERLDFKIINKEQVVLKNEYLLQKNLLGDFRLFFDECKKIKFNLLYNVLFIIKVDVELEKEEKIYSKTYAIDLLDKSKKRIYNINNIKSILTKGFQ